MKYINIPMDRVGVLIGNNGEIKKELENKTSFKINIDSKAGEVIIDDNEVNDPLLLIKIENIIKAIGRGFSPEKAFILFKDEADLFIFNLHDYVGKKDSHLRRLKSRIIGKEGKTKRVLETLTEGKISIYGHTISIISDIIKMNILKKSIDMLLTGSKHATVYRYIESHMKELKRTEQFN